MKSTNTEIKLGMPELPTRSDMVSEPPKSEVLGNTSESGMIELSIHNHKLTREKNRILWKCRFESDKNVRGYIERMDQLWIERGDREMSNQRLRTQVQNIEKKRLLSDVEIGEVIGADREEDDVEPLNEESDEVDGDLEVAVEEEQDICVDVAEVYVSVERSVDVCWRGKEIRLLKDEEKKILRRLREVMLISEKLSRTWLRKSFGKWQRTTPMKSEKNLGGSGEFRKILQSGEKMSVD